MNDKIIQLRDEEGNNLSPLVALDAVLDKDGTNVKDVIKNVIDGKLDGLLDDYYDKEEVNGLIGTSGRSSSVVDKLVLGDYVISKNLIDGVDVKHNGNILTTIKSDIIRTNIPVSYNYNNYATESYVDYKLNDLIGLAPEALKTIQELADAVGDDENFSATITNNLATKANKEDVYNKAQTYTKDEINDLIDEAVNGRNVLLSNDEIATTAYVDGRLNDLSNVIGNRLQSLLNEISELKNEIEILKAKPSI